MFAESHPQSERVEYLLNALLSTLPNDLEEDIPRVVLNAQIGNIRCTLVCMRTASAGVRLSNRELEIVQLITQGLPNKAIALELKIKPCTVAAYIKRIFIKLEVNTRAEAVAKVFQANLL